MKDDDYVRLPSWDEIELALGRILLSGIRRCVKGWQEFKRMQQKPREDKEDENE